MTIIQFIFCENCIYFFRSKTFLNVDVYGIKITFTCADISGGVGGGLIINCDTNGWDQAEWGNDGAGKAITAVETGNADEYTVTRLLDAPVFQADNTYANFCLSHWWGGDIVITGAEFLGADGKALGAATASSGEVSAEASEGDDAKAPLPKTGLDINIPAHRAETDKISIFLRPVNCHLDI